MTGPPEREPTTGELAPFLWSIAAVVGVFELVLFVTGWIFSA